MANAGNRVQELDSIDVQDADGMPASSPIVIEAQKRFRRCAEWESNARERFIDDVKFAEGDSDNGYQWPAAVKRNRDVDKRPCLTMNVLRQHNKQIINDQLKNKAAIKIRAIGGGASVQSANLFAALIHDTEYRSNAQAAYKCGSKFQVQGGIGWWRIATRYCSEETFDQEPVILPIRDPLSVYMDPDCQQDDCSDAKFAFVFDLVPRDEFWRMYPEYEGVVSLQPFGVGADDDDWISRDYVRVAEYFRKELTDDTLVSFIDPRDGMRKSLLKSKMPKEVWEQLHESPLTRQRPVQLEKICWYLIVGSEIADKTEWPGKFIPLIRCLGDETVIEGIMDRKGHTRSMKDAQRMYNYNSSAQVEFVALQSKTPYIASAKAIEDYEVMWNTANLQNHSVLIYNHLDPDNPDKPLAPPIRQEPPKSSSGFQEGMETAFNQMMMTSGQWQNQMGMMGNERTGAAINARQHQADNSVYNFQDAYEDSIRYTGKQLLDLYPKLYDTKRLMRLQLEDGEEFELEIDPKSPQALQEYMDAQGNVVKRVLNPKLGQYDVQSDVGKAYGTRREETVQALTIVLTQAPTLVPIIGDLLLRAMDFKEAQEAAQRLRRMVPPQALGKGPSPNEQKLQAALTASQSALAKALSESAKRELKLVGKDEMRAIDVYKAHTDRVKALSDLLPEDPQLLRHLLMELDDETLVETLKPILQATERATAREAEMDNDDEAPAAAAPSDSAPQHPVPGARQAPDGEWYIPDATRPGKYLRLRAANA